MSQRNETSAASLSDLKFEYRSLYELKPSPQNPRKHSKKQLKKLAASIKKFGFLVPVLVDQDLNILAGHGRMQAADMAGLTKIPTICVDHLTPAEAKAYRIADNRLCEIGEWDEETLAIQIKELSVEDPDFSAEALGFEVAEVDIKIEGLNAITEPEGDPADKFTAAQGPAITMPGTTWRLAGSFIYCGDARQPSSYEALMPCGIASAMVVDPPFNVEIAGNVSGLGTVRHREFAMAAGEMSVAEYTGFLTDFQAEAVKHLKAGALAYVFIDWRHVVEVLTAGKKVYSEHLNTCVWVKSNAGMGSLYRSQHEFVCVFKSGTAEHRNNILLGKHGRNRTNVWRYAGASTFGFSGDEDNLLHLHPTVKPISMIADAIKDCTARGEIVLDPFLGSGTTLIAAERAGRRCYGIELDPLYVDTAVLRWQKLTGNDAIDLSSGRTFNAIAAERTSSDVA